LLLLGIRAVCSCGFCMCGNWGNLCQPF